MTTSAQDNDTRRADGPTLVAVHAMPGQKRPFLRVSTMRPFAALACEALLEADRVLAQSGRGIAVKLPSAAALAHSVTSPSQK